MTTTLVAATAELRSACCRLIDEIPDEGLAELYECLERIRDFHRTNPDTVLPEPGVREIAARYGETSVRPEFHVEEE